MNGMTTVLRGLWAVAMLGALSAMYLLVFDILRADSAERQAQCSAVAIAVTVVPYCLARAAEEVARKRG